MKSKKDDSKIESKDSKALLSFINANFTKNEKTVAIDKIMAGTFVSRQVVYNWIYGYSRIPELYKKKIQEIFAKEIFCEMDA